MGWRSVKAKPGFIARSCCLFAACLSALFAGANPLPAHSLSGTETWVHIARPGVELRITFFSERLAQAAQIGLSRSGPGSDGIAGIWVVEGDGKACKADAASVRTERSNGHLTVKLRYPCASISREVVLTPRISAVIGRSRINVLNVLVGDHLVEFQLQSRKRPVTIPIGKLIADRDVVLSDDFLGGEDRSQQP
ncbi:hypothetical protein [Hoeflea poritis]|uniref:ATP-dependent zinc protease domain-containing protein n=1 Tax=Hoeflea poritis TaxID=2993659 RepID=A0ABT4VII9_9HYPH|nr:hypothetical protein [Hoeflea poritis]MDA4844513.1 hypothetical protein [Hoeflea poritis]